MTGKATVAISNAACGLALATPLHAPLYHRKKILGLLSAFIARSVL
jgi:hypothetical protein